MTGRLAQRMRINLYVLPLFLLLSILPFAHAQATYTIPISSIWQTGRIIVQIQSTPTWAHDSVIQAMQIWNQAQQWFRTTYYPTGGVLKLVEGSPGDAVVTFAWNPIICGAYGSAGGCTTSWSGYNAHAKTTIDLQWGPDYTSAIAVHELGRVLGIGTATYPQDLMNINNDVHMPSTLDLYGVHLLASGSSAHSATLPPQIPYMTVPESAVPEFPTSIIIVVTTLSSLLMIRRGNKSSLR